MKGENHPWLQNIKYLLYKIGLGDIWLSSGMGERNYIKSIVTERLQDLYIQQVNEYATCANANNNDKCKILSLCTTYNGKYHKQKYLSEIESPEIRSIITKVRIDINCTWDSNKRSFRYRNVATNECNYCKEVKSVEHLLLYCKHPDIVENRKVLCQILPICRKL